MKVALVTPLSSTSIATDSILRAIPFLQREWDLHVWCPLDAVGRECSAPVQAFAGPDDEVIAALSGYDLTVFVIGGSPWDGQILPLTRLFPGLVVLHDAAAGDAPPVARSSLEPTGHAAPALARVATSALGATLADLVGRELPASGMTEWPQVAGGVAADEDAVVGSLGVVVHSRWHRLRLRGATLGAIDVVPAPVPSASVAAEKNDDGAVAELLAGLADDDLLVVHVGPVHADRHATALFDAVSLDPVLAARVHLWAVGPAPSTETADRLVDEAERSGLGGRYVITGAVSDGLLARILERSDLSSALGDPVPDGRSPSVLAQMLAGAVVAVYDHAQFAELPDDAVVRVVRADGTPAITRALRGMAADRGRRAEIGRRACAHVEAAHSGERYAAALIEAAERALATRPRASMAQRIAERLRRLDLGDPVVDRVAAYAVELTEPA